jgi:hypothetical protein
MILDLAALKRMRSGNKIVGFVGYNVALGTVSPSLW